MDDLLGLLTFLKGTGTWGTILASVIVALTLAVILVARFRDLWERPRTPGQIAELQDRTLLLIDKLMASEEALRRHIDNIGRDRDAKVEEIEDLRVQMALLRSQRRRLIEMLRRALPAAHTPEGRA